MVLSSQSSSSVKYPTNTLCHPSNNVRYQNNVLRHHPISQTSGANNQVFVAMRINSTCYNNKHIVIMAIIRLLLW